MDFVKEALFNSESFDSFCEILVGDLVKRCSSDGGKYFMDNFMTGYMAPVSREANSIVESYIEFLTPEQLSDLKENLQKIIEKWLQNFFTKVNGK